MCLIICKYCGEPVKCLPDCGGDVLTGRIVYYNVNIFSICVCVRQPVSVAVGLESLAAQRVAVARPVPGSWMVKRPDREASLMQ